MFFQWLRQIGLFCHFMCFSPPLHLFFSYDGAHVLNKGPLLFCGVTHLLIVCNLFSVRDNALKKVSVSDVLTCTGTPWQKQVLWPDLVELFSAILFHKNNTVWGQGDAGLERSSTGCSLLFGCLVDDINSHRAFPSALTAGTVVFHTITSASKESPTDSALPHHLLLP